MYISGGENVYPAEVENVLYQLPQIAEAAVLGQQDERWGETGMAVLVLKPGETLSADAVIDHCQGGWPGSKCQQQSSSLKPYHGTRPARS